MNIGFWSGGAILSLCLVTAGTRVGRPVARVVPRVGAQATSGGSRVPCAVPLRWRIARVDRQLGLSLAEARAALDKAADAWESAVGMELFARDSAQGFPVRLVYDERQEAMNALLRARASADSVGSRLQRERTELQERVRGQEQSQARHAALQQDLDRRVSEHNDSVRAWNERGGAPARVEAQLDASGAALEKERAEFERRTQELRAARAALQADLDDLERREAEQRKEAEAASRAHASGSVEAGVYREAVRMQDGSVQSVSREIRIYRFADDRELVVVAAHELGHALGLGHVTGEDAIMNGEHEMGSEGGAAVHVSAVDVQALRTRCPSLVPRAR